MGSAPAARVGWTPEHRPPSKGLFVVTFRSTQPRAPTGPTTVMAVPRRRPTSMRCSAGSGTVGRPARSTSRRAGSRSPGSLRGLEFPTALPEDVIYVTSQLVFTGDGKMADPLLAAFGLWTIPPYSQSRTVGQSGVLERHAALPFGRIGRGRRWVQPLHRESDRKLRPDPSRGPPCLGAERTGGDDDRVGGSVPTGTSCSTVTRSNRWWHGLWRWGWHRSTAPSRPSPTSPGCCSEPARPKQADRAT